MAYNGVESQILGSVFSTFQIATFISTKVSSNRPLLPHYLEDYNINTARSNIEIRSCVLLNFDAAEHIDVPIKFWIRAIQQRVKRMYHLAGVVLNTSRGTTWNRMWNWLVEFTPIFHFYYYLVDQVKLVMNNSVLVLLGSLNCLRFRNNFIWAVGKFLEFESRVMPRVSPNQFCFVEGASRLSKAQNKVKQSKSSW